MSDVASFPMFIEHPGDIADHPLVLALGDGERMGALGLYGVIGAWAARYAPSDGIVPGSVVTMHDGRTGKYSGALVSCGLWTYDQDRGTFRYAHWPKPSTESNGYPS
jgi:hypothetical protein